MKRHVILMLGLMTLASMILPGCGDDDCPACPKSVNNALMYASVAISSERDLSMYGHINGEDATMPDIDSVKLEGVKADMFEDYGAFGLGYYLTYSEPSGSLISGDSVKFDIFTPHGKCECEIAVLANPEDMAEFIGWNMSHPYDTVELDTDVEISWHPVPNAEWYLVSTNAILDWSYESVIYNSFHTTDTTFTIPATQTSMDCQFNVNVASLVGPTPDSEGGNITGGYVKGIICSGINSGLTFYVGDGLGPYLATPEKNKPENDFLQLYKDLQNK